mmetsp:Transcript_20151/g.57805  ORF Transcript_20151/g.57805 Transcript_20151/m.57805 type:complete len:204 (-) Transcript_20151:587-1198(-)
MGGPPESSVATPPFQPPPQRWVAAGQPPRARRVPGGRPGLQSPRRRPAAVLDAAARRRRLPGHLVQRLPLPGPAVRAPRGRAAQPRAVEGQHRSVRAGGDGGPGLRGILRLGRHRLRQRPQGAVPELRGAERPRLFGRHLHPLPRVRSGPPGDGRASVGRASLLGAGCAMVQPVGRHCRHGRAGRLCIRRRGARQPVLGHHLQ